LQITDVRDNIQSGRKLPPRSRGQGGCSCEVRAAVRSGEHGGLQRW